MIGFAGCVAPFRYLETFVFASGDWISAPQYH